MPSKPFPAAVPAQLLHTLQAKSEHASSLQAPIQPPMNDGNRPATGGEPEVLVRVRKSNLARVVAVRVVARQRMTFFCLHAYFTGEPYLLGGRRGQRVAGELPVG